MILALHLGGCHPATSAPREITNIDEIGWADRLRQQRPDLWNAPNDNSVDDPAWLALVIQPAYRDELVASQNATWKSIVTRAYTPALQARDRAWVASLRDYATTFDSGAEVRASSSSAYAFFVVGAPGRPVNGIDYKIYLDFADFESSIAPKVLGPFLTRLHDRGFTGDFKADLREGRTRFDYNQIIFHASTIEMAQCAESTALDYFGEQLAYVARGLDVWRDGNGYDWHHYLLAYNLASLPPDAIAFVDHRIARDPKACPSPAH